MTPEEKNDLHYVCSLVEFLSRKLHVRHRDLANAITPTVFHRWMGDAAVNHCLSFDEVADTAIAQLHLQNGDYDVSTGCRYKIPSVEDIGALYQQLIQAVQKKDSLYSTFKAVFSSFIPKKISNFNSSFYYATPDYIRACYEAGHVLD